MIPSSVLSTNRYIVIISITLFSLPIKIELHLPNLSLFQVLMTKSARLSHTMLIVPPGRYPFFVFISI